MITNKTTIREFPVQRGSILVALECYQKWRKWRLVGFIWFVADVIDYLLHGFVICRPTCFMMLKLVTLDNKEPAWFFRIAVGDLPELLSCVPCFLPKVCFCRRDDGRIRTYDFERVIQLINAKG